jgi:inorganic triphosphatase YgiF
MGLEREVKLAVTDGFVLPDIAALIPGSDVVDHGMHMLDATYWDTASLALFHSGWGLRYRSRNGANGTWTLKGPSTEEGPAVTREEIETQGSSERIPVGMRDQVTPMLGGESLRPVARLNAERRVVEVRTSRSFALELDDDRVRVLTPDARTAARLRELEVELHGDAEAAVVAELLGALQRRGARLDSTPKLARALAALGYIDPAPT